MVEAGGASETLSYTALMPRRVLLHIGTHKTGTTSIQHFLQDHNDDLLADAGAWYPPGFFLPSLHADLPLLTIRTERTWPARVRFPETQDEIWQEAARAHVRRQVESASQELLVYSHEDLSYLRFDDELARLRDLFADRVVQVVVCLRDKATFLRSYSEQLVASGFALTDDQESFAYVEADSWLADYDALVAGYRRCFGDGNVEVIDYEASVGIDGSVIPTIAERIGIPRSALPALDRYFLNRTGMQLRPSDEQVGAIRKRLSEQTR